MGQILPVTAAIIFEGDKLLIAQRKADAHLGLHWEFPGGKLEFGEDPRECLKREIKEELDIDIEVGPIIETVSRVEGSRQILLMAYKCEYLSGEIKAKDCEDFKWINLKDWNEFLWCPADIPIIETLINKG